LVRSPIAVGETGNLTLLVHLAGPLKYKLDRYRYCSQALNIL